MRRVLVLLCVICCGCMSQVVESDPADGSLMRPIPETLDLDVCLTAADTCASLYAAYAARNEQLDCGFYIPNCPDMLTWYAIDGQVYRHSSIDSCVDEQARAPCDELLSVPYECELELCDVQR